MAVLSSTSQFETCAKTPLDLIALTLLISFVSSVATTKPKTESFRQEITRKLAEGGQPLSEFQQEIEGKDVIIFLGSTKSGKSTITNYLIGTRLKAYRSEMLGLKIKEWEASEGPTIGQSSLSHTTVPGVYPVKDTNEVIVDSPGFDDNRGAVQNVINALYINRINSARTVRFVIVSDIQEVAGDNVNLFISTLEQMHNLLQNSKNVPVSVAIIFTKVPKNHNKSQIANLLKRQFLNDELNIVKYLVTNVVNNPKLIGIFRAPTKEGELNDDIVVNVLEAIAASEPIDMEKFKVTFTLSDKAREALLKVYAEYTDTNYFKQEVRRIIEEYEDFFLEKWVFASFDEELASAQKELKKVQLAVGKQRAVRRNSLTCIQKSLEILLGSATTQEFATNFQFIVMLDLSSIVDEKYRKIIDLNYAKTLEQLLDSIDTLLQSIGSEIRQREEEHVAFPSQRDLIATSSTIARALVYRAYHAATDVLEAAADKVSSMYNSVKQLPGKEAVLALSDLTPKDVKSATLGEICNIAETVAEKAVAYGPKVAAATGTIGVGAVGSASYLLYQEIYGKRFEIRKAQHRGVYSWLESCEGEFLCQGQQRPGKTEL